MAFLTASLVLFLLVFSSKVVAEGQRITAEPGDNVILTCRAAENKDVRVVEWSRTDLESDQYVLLYRFEVTKGQSDPEGQSPSFRNRVSLLDVKNRDVSLVLKNVTTDDTGTYECRVVREGNDGTIVQDYELISTVNLRVEAGQINIRAEPGDTVILPCRADENKDVRVVEWRRTDLESDQYVLLYNDRQFDPEGQSPSFINRVDLLDVKNGDVSLVLKNVTTNDTERYECRVDYARNNRSKRAILDTEPISIINLTVEAGNKEKLKEDGENEDGLIVGLSVCAIVVLVVVVAVLLQRMLRNSSPRPEPHPPPEDEPLQDTTGLYCSDHPYQP